MLGGVLKGDVHMNGRNISLACFYGNSFRGKSWARFSIKEPRLSIVSEALETSLKNGKVAVTFPVAEHLKDDSEAGSYTPTLSRVFFRT